jgi:aminoglycoside 6'-N-acetyltransferase I
MRARVRPVAPADAVPWQRLRHALWPDGSEAEHAAEIATFFAGEAREPLAVLVAEDDAGDLLGFAELSIRTIAEGCETDHVAYLEGWYVVPAARRHGVGKALVAAAEAWARAQGCTELASDTELDNVASAAAHAALGFVEVNRVRCFRKAL